MDIIHLLPDSVANQIAAGEVIQRPASCLKELVENSLDAGATRIQVLVRDAGRTLLQVIDNGKGMSETDVRMAFERHATSKIKDASDLFALRTMGFRGEALASICAVAQVEVLTRREEDEMGSLLEINGSSVVRQEPVQCPIGTNIKVKNLFFNVPVRRKFLKTDQTELRNLLSDFYRIVLVYPHIQFTFVSNDEVMMDLTPGTEKQRIEAVFGKSSRQSFTSQLVDVSVDTELVAVRGFVGKPEYAGKQALQYFFVNGRFMRHPYFHKAVLSAYAGMLAADANPPYFIYFDINPDAIDVNIHPTKTEIKFADEQYVFQILVAAVREALGKFNIAPSLDFDDSGKVDIPVTDGNSISKLPTITSDSLYNPFTVARTKPAADNWEQLYTPRFSRTDSVPAYDAVPDRPKQDTESRQIFAQDWEGTRFFQYAGKYILFSSSLGLMAIDQHRAHICILYEQFARQLSIGKGLMQQLLFEEIWEIDHADVETVENILEDLRYVGFELERFSPNGFRINSVPALLNGRNAVAALDYILADIRELTGSVRNDWQKSIALSLAKDSAIPYGKILSEIEMKDMASKLFALPSYRRTPDGKVVVNVMPTDEIDRYFAK